MTPVPAPRARRRAAAAAVAAAVALILVPGAVLAAQERGGGGEGIEAAGPIPGFTAESSVEQRAREARFQVVPTSDSARANARWLAAEPHMAGTAAQRRLGDRLAAELERLGFHVEAERYDVYLPHPARVRISLLRPERSELETLERAGRSAPVDSTYFLSWNAYSANGRVEAPVVYANRGLPEDYAALERVGVEVAGRIVLVRYGGAFRGVKVREAERRGAVGAVLYSDPADDGFGVGDTLPQGPHRPADAVQRGTVKYLWRYTGDPLTPGEPARPGRDRLEPAEAADLPSIPVAPLPYGQARRILAALDGPAAPEEFQGGLPLRYRTGGSGTVLLLDVEQEYAMRPIRNVIARLPGETSQRVILGNHYDAWLHGGVDPHSGTAVMLEIARGLAKLRTDGWTPRRGITLAFWDAEEYGAVGSTEWVEHHAAELQRDAVAYFNVDMFTAGTLHVSGSPSLRDVVLSAAEAVPDPVTGEPLAVGWRARQRAADESDGTDAAAAAATDPGAASLRERPAVEPRLEPLGAGSDWTAFFHFAGVPSLQWTMNGRGAYGVYHSARDDFDYYRQHADSAFVHTPALARVMGVAALRLADADALPFHYSLYAERIAGYIDSLEREAPRVPGVDSLRDRVRALREAAAGLEARQARALAAGDTTALRRIDERLPAVEQAFLDEAGQPDRPWYRHRIYTPGRWTGYASLTLPGPREALRAGDRAALQTALERLGAALERATRALETSEDP